MNEQELQIIVQSNPNDHAAWHALGLLAFRQNNMPRAIKCLEAAIAADKKVGLYHRNIGEMYRRIGQVDKAITSGRKAAKLMPGDVDARYNLGLALSDAGQFDEAIRIYRQALNLDARHNLSWNNLGSALEKTGDKAGALTAYESALSIDPDHAEAQNNVGAIYSEQGRLDEARAAFQRAIDIQHDFIEAHYNLSSLKKYSRDDPHLAMLEQVFAQRQHLSAGTRIRYAFALGKALDDIGEIDRAFAAYDEGNRLQHATLPMDEHRAEALAQAIITTFDEKFFAERQTWQGADADPTRVPIFIVGMPRSGTTLLEQILCSHVSVHGAGELTDLHETIAQATKSTASRHFTAGVTSLSAADLKRIGNSYLERVWKLSPESRFITDKMPANFFYLGLIHLALPHARIIHSMRDPMDSCFSCFSRLFNDTMEFAYDQRTLGRYYVRYMTLMRHWHKVLPAGTILDLPYEDMVADIEGQARRVLEFVGLPWDDNCLNFHENKRLVKTASVAQVRMPIYTSSVARWRKFARHLRPLFELVKDFRPQDEAEALVFQTDTENPDQLHARGMTLYRQDSFQEALDLYNRALAARPAFPAALNSRGFLLQDLDRVEEALADFSRAVELEPEMAMARLNLGMAQLKLGDWTNGWVNYEARWIGSAEAGAGKLLRPATPLPQWHDEDGTHGKRLLVFTEQGFGDTFQMARFLPSLAQRFAKVGFACSQPTQRLMEWSFTDAVLTLTRLPTTDDAWADWDCQCALMSLPGILGIQPDTVPAVVPYFRVPGTHLQHWRERLERTAPGRLRIGIAWAGRKEHLSDKRRSLTFNQLLPLFRNGRVTWISLQKWAPQDVRPEIPAGVDWLDWTEELSDFADSAALVSQLDLIISIDSAMVHLAGALGRPVWMLDRFDNEWRWLRQRNDSPWYPTLRIFRQASFGDWGPVIEAVGTALSELDAPRAIAIAPNRPKPASESPPSRPKVSAAPGLTPDQALQAAAQLQSAGRLNEAESLLQKILSVQPDNGHALHLLGIISYQAGKPQVGIDLVNQAVILTPNTALFHSNLAEMYRQQGRSDQAVIHGELAVTIDKSMAAAWSNLGIACYDAKLYDRCEECHTQALQFMPQLVQSLNNMGSLMRARKDKVAAITWYRKTLAINPDHLEALSNLGAVLLENNQFDAAIEPLQHALTLSPNFAEALCNLGLAHYKNERQEVAINLLRRSLQLRPNYPEALVGLATVLQDKGDVAEATRLLRQALQASPDNVSAWSMLGSALLESDKPGEAEAAFSKALEINPECVDALTGLGNLRIEQGKIKAAEKILLQALAVDADSLGARFHLIQAHKVLPGNEHVAALEARLMSETSPNKLITLHYALGKAYDDLKNWDAAFPHFLEGARQKRSRIDYDPTLDDLRTEQIMRIIDGEFIHSRQGAGDSSPVPVFVLGMPRSGTTLTEQILASHPGVFGAGELRDLLDICQQPDETGALISYPNHLSRLDKQRLTRWGRDYVAGLRRRAPAALHITDKMPTNYLALGLIPLMLPNARIIHVRRNPVDTCVSCFTHLFSRHQEATYELAELGRHYVNYARLMDHWRMVLPADTFLEVQYEDVVANMPAQARRLINFVELPWNDACLDFHKTERNIRTASVTQVRQPIYKSSVARWKNYEKYLGPLLDALGKHAET